MAVRGYIVQGVVQGVGFRWFTQRTGERLGLAGHVRNLPDGTVEVHARGDDVTLDALRDALLQGPPASRVTGLEEIDPDPRTPEHGFLMERW